LGKRWRSLRERLLLEWADISTGKPALVLLVSFILAAISIGFAATSLRFDPDRSRLIDPNLPWQKRYATYKRNFPHWEDAVVVVDMGDAPTSDARASAEHFLTALARAVAADDRLSAITTGMPTVDTPVGLIFAEPTNRVAARVTEINRSAPVLGANQPQTLLRLTLLSPSLAPLVRTELADLIERLVSAGTGAVPDNGVLGASPAIQRFESPSGRFLFAFASMGAAAADGDNDTASKADARARDIAALRSHIRIILASTNRDRDEGARIHAGVTGVPVIEADEAQQSVHDASRATGLALLLILALLFAVYRGAWAPLIAIGALLLGVAWTFGYLTLVVGRLQLLSVVFAVILLGLGVDTAIHLIARLELVRPNHDHMPDAIRRTFRSVGPGVLTSAVTAAAAFAATAVTGFDGLAEMGLIAAGGVLLCAVSVMTAFPAAMEILPHPERIMRKRSGGESRPFMRGAVNIVDRKAPIFAAVALALTVVAAVVGAGVHYDPDLLKLLPDTIESARWERALSQDDEQSVWHALVPAPNAASAASLARSLRSEPRVASVGDAGALFPADLDAKRALLQQLPDPGDLAAYEATVTANPDALRAAAAALRARFGGGNVRFDAACDALASLTDPQALRAIGAYRRDRAALATSITALRHASPPTVRELPDALRERWIGRDGSLLLRILPKKADDCGDSVLASGCLAPFAEEVLAASTLDSGSLATGPAIQIHRSTALIERAYQQAALLAVVVVFLLLLLDFHSPLDAICAMTPVIAAAALTAAVMRLTGVSLNFANMITLPLLAGIGVSAGVHAVHRWRQQPYDLPAGLAGGCGRSITLTIATTILGFASMLTAQHRGIRSLGFVMSIGLTMVWLVTVFALPALLRLRTPPAAKTLDIDLHLERQAAIPAATKEKQPTPVHAGGIPL